MKVALTGGPAIPIARSDGVQRGAAWLTGRLDRLCDGRHSNGSATYRGERWRVTVLTKPDPEAGRGRPSLTREAARRSRCVVHDHLQFRRPPRRLPCWTSRQAIEESLVRGGGERALRSKAVTLSTRPPASCRQCRSTSTPGRSPARPCQCSSNSRRNRRRGVPLLDVAANGTLVYVRGSGVARLPVWVDRAGRRSRSRDRAPTAT